MQSFLEEVVQKVSKEHNSLEHLIFVLPSKRAGTFLRNAIARTSKKTAFAPTIYSIEDFIEKISGLFYATNMQQLFELYTTYCQNTEIEKDSFYSFSKWGQTLLQDFNEIDRYLIDAEKLFSNLSAIQEINHWSVQPGKTKMMEDYLSFWNNLYPIYRDFNAALIKQGMGHQGLVYRKATSQLAQYLKGTNKSTHIFIGFNALNASEEYIIQTILKTTKADIFWDTDLHFLKDPIHDASLFLRKYEKSWPYLKKHPIKGVSDFYTDKKNIHITGVPKNITQAKYAAKLLDKINKTNPKSIKNTAVILGDENLLNPILHAIPKEIESVNITMGYPLDKSSLYNLFYRFIELYINPDKRGWFYQNILSFLSQPFIKELLKASSSKDDNDLTTAIKTNNWTYVTIENINKFSAPDSKLPLLFVKEQPSPRQLIKRCLNVIEELKNVFIANEDFLALEYLYRFHEIFNQILELVQKHSFIDDLKSLLSLYKELLSAETVDFQGNPLEGLQIMGMLESRNLDFESIIITSVNEGILPSGKSNNSFIPFDLKTVLGLPTYKEKDAIYTYHFYRLLQRAKNIYIIYNTEPDALEGREKSRLISQLLTDSSKTNDIIATEISPSIEPIKHGLTSYSKDTQLISLIKKHAASGFSPSSLSNYIRNPIDFYKASLLGINEQIEVEETVASNTFGTIVHDTLEDIYTPFLGDFLTEKGLTDAKNKIPFIVQKHFTKSYKEGDITQGKNLIAYNVAIRYVQNYIALEIKEVKVHKIKIIGLEANLRLALNIPELDCPVILKGKLDRIDEKDGTIRIIDYKTGKVESKHVEVVAWDEIITNYDFSKAFQLLCYALMYNSKQPINQIEAGIISFKNIKKGLLKFATKEKKGSRTRDHQITQDTLSIFQDELKKLILEIFNMEIPFVEKEV